MLLAVNTPNVIGAFRSVLCHSLKVVYYHVQKIDLRLPNLWTKIFTGNVDFWGEEKTGLLEKKKKSSRNKDESQQWTLPLKRVTFGVWTPALTSNASVEKFGAEPVK